MGAVIPQYDIEGYEDLEGRWLQFADGQRRYHADWGIAWAAYDFIVNMGFYTEQQLLALVEENQLAVGGSFRESFRGVVSYISLSLREAFGIDNEGVEAR